MIGVTASIHHSDRGIEMKDEMEKLLQENQYLKQLLVKMMNRENNTFAKNSEESYPR